MHSAVNDFTTAVDSFIIICNLLVLVLLMYTMDSVSSSHHEGSISPSLPHIFSAVKQEPSDCWNPQLLNTSNGLVSENYSTYTSLETLYPDTSYASSSHTSQYYTYANSPSCIQSLYPCANMQEDPDVYIVQPTVYRDVDLSYSARDEGLGSSPSSFNSSSPPLNIPATISEQPVVSLSSASNYDFHRTKERSSPEDLAYEEFPLPECGNCGSRINVTWYTNHYLCGVCFLEKTRPTTVHQPDDGQNDRKRKRSATVNKKENQICTNCETESTTLWRRSNSGSSVCNACGLYEKLHKTPRPKSMRKDQIQTRKRKPKASQNRQRKKNGTSKTQPNTQRVQPCSSNNTEQFALPTYNSLQMRSIPLNLNPIRNTAPLPPMNGNSFYQNYRPDMCLFSSVPPNEVMNNSRIIQPDSPAQS